MSWLIIAAAVIIVLAFPAYTIILAIITIIRAKWRHSLAPIAAATAPSPWSHVRTTFFQGTVFHIRHRPVIHAFKYPLYFSVVDLDEASELFGSENVHPATHLSPAEDQQKLHYQQQRLHANISKSRGTLWPLSSLMLLRDIDHFKNGEGGLGDTGTCTSSTTSSSSPTSTDATKILRNASMRERICTLVHERTNGKLDLRNSVTTNNNNNNDETNEDEKSRSKESQARKIILVTHLMYYGYCFNPVSLFFILKSTKVNNEEEKKSCEKDTTEEEVEEEEEKERENEIEAIVVEVSNTPWNEMAIYVLHPDSVDTLEYTIYPPLSPSVSASSTTTTTTTTTVATTKYDTTTHRYRWRKNFHVSPFMTMDFDYDWKFQVSCDRIKVEATMIRRPAEDGGVLEVDKEEEAIDEKKSNVGQLFFTAGFDIQRTIFHPPTVWYPLQLARIILRFPVYCFIIQLWIHYEAFKLLMKGVQFIPHPQGSETGASRAIAAVMRPIFGAMEVVDAWWSRRKSWRSGNEGKLKEE